LDILLVVVGGFIYATFFQVILTSIEKSKNVIK